MINNLGNAPEENWESLKEPVILEMNHATLSMKVIQTLKALRANEGEFQIVHLETNRKGELDPQRYSVFDKFTVRLRGGKTPPEVRRGDLTGDLFPPRDFMRWWDEAFKEKKTAFGTGYYWLRLVSVKPEPHAKIQEQRVVHTAPVIERPAREEAVREEPPQREPEPVQAQPPREPEALPEGAVEFSNVNDLKNRAMEVLDGFREKIGGKVEATLTLELESGSSVSMRVEHPGGRTLVVWTYPEGGKRFSLVGRELARDIADVAGGERIERISLSPRSSE